MKVIMTFVAYVPSFELDDGTKKVAAEIALEVLLTTLGELGSARYPDFIRVIWHLRLVFEGLVTCKGTLLSTYARYTEAGDLYYDAAAMNITKYYSLCDELNALTLRLAERLFPEKDEGAAWVIKRCVVKLLKIDLHGIIHAQNNVTSTGSSNDEMDVDEEFSEKSSDGVRGILSQNSQSVLALSYGWACITCLLTPLMRLRT